jgi:hypothetical protein
VNDDDDDDDEDEQDRSYDELIKISNEQHRRQLWSQVRLHARVELG